jgi:hypothetical protein
MNNSGACSCKRSASIFLGLSSLAHLLRDVLFRPEKTNLRLSLQLVARVRLWSPSPLCDR